MAASTEEALRKELVALGAIRDSLVKENEELRRQLQESETGDLLEELEELKAECQDRVATAEKTIIILRGERETLLRKLEKAEKDHEGHASALAERDSTIQQLRAEGEALSQKHGDAVLQCRKLKTSLREAEAARDELAAKLQAANEDASTLADGEKEKLGDLHSTVREQAAEIQQLQSRIAMAVNEANAREDALRAEMVQLQRHCSTLEAAKDELATSQVDAAWPLMRQLEDVSRASRAAADAAAEVQAQLQARLRDAEVAAVAAQSAERAAKSRCAAAEETSRERAARVAALTKEVADLSHKLGAIDASYDALQGEVVQLRERQIESTAALQAAEARVRTAYEDIERITRVHSDAKRMWTAREAELLAVVNEHNTAPANQQPQGGDVSTMERRLLEVEAQRKRDASLLLQTEHRAMQHEQEARDARRVSQQLTELRVRHNKCLELLGERQRRVEELTLDLQEARQIYREQLLMLLK